MAVRNRVAELEAALARAHAERDELLKDVENLCMQVCCAASHSCGLCIWLTTRTRHAIMCSFNIVSMSREVLPTHIRETKDIMH